MAVCFNAALVAELDLAVGLNGLPSNYAKDVETQGKVGQRESVQLLSFHRLANSPVSVVWSN